MNIAHPLRKEVCKDHSYSQRISRFSIHWSLILLREIGIPADLDPRYNHVRFVFKGIRPSRVSGYELVEIFAGSNLVSEQIVTELCPGEWNTHTPAIPAGVTFQLSYPQRTSPNFEVGKRFGPLKRGDVAPFGTYRKRP